MDYQKSIYFTVEQIINFLPSYVIHLFFWAKVYIDYFGLPPPQTDRYTTVNINKKKNDFWNEFISDCMQYLRTIREAIMLNVANVLLC